MLNDKKIILAGCLAAITILSLPFLIAMMAMGLGESGFSGGSNGSIPNGTFGNTGGELANGSRLTVDQIKDLLTNKISYGYNLAPYVQQIYDSSVKFNINPLFALGVANKDSSLGTAGAGKTCRNPGNMENRSDKFAQSGVTALGNCSDVYGGNSRWSAFSTYGDGMQAKAWLLRANYLDDGLTDLFSIINTYCPPSECDVPQYVSDVEHFMKKYGDMYPQGASK